jgi:hypothetical protein
MPTEAFIERRFQAKTEKVIDQANEIIAEYQALGFALTLRQLYYQFVARRLLDNTAANYKRLGQIVSDARLAGRIDWDAIEDRTRDTVRVTFWDDPADIINSAASDYREDLWASQDVRPYIWIEKAALVGVIEGVCTRWRTPYFACRGYNSQSEQYRSSKEFASLKDSGIRPVILHLGDHDPSGLDMTRDNRDRSAQFARTGIEVRRLALNLDQVRQFNPPPNFAKEDDARYESYVAEYGTTNCWELDASTRRNAIVGLVDRAAWDAAEDAERENRETLERVSDRWDDVEQLVNGG